MENKIGKNFNSLAQRMVYSYAGTFPEFVPVKSVEASELSQRDMYGFLKDMVTRLYEDPALLSLPDQEDEYYKAGELQKHKPKLIIAMKNCLKKISEFYMLLIQLGELGSVQGDSLYVGKEYLKLTPNMLKKLERFGLSSDGDKDGIVFRCEAYPDLFPAWKLLASVSGGQKNPVIFFSRCMFDPGYSYPGDIFESLTNDQPAYMKLKNFFEQNGYRRVDCRENEVSLDWAQNYGKKDEPLKGSWAEREHGGISIWFDYSKQNQIYYGLRVPRYGELLAHFNELDDRLKAFVISKTKKCNGCRYCTQTDKTGTRKPKYAAVEHNGEYQLCMLYPGFSYIWKHIDDAVVTDIISFLTWIDRLFAERKPG